MHMPPKPQCQWDSRVSVSLFVISPRQAAINIRGTWAQAWKSGRLDSGTSSVTDWLGPWFQPIFWSVRWGHHFLVSWWVPCEVMLLKGLSLWVTEMLGEWFPLPLHVLKAWPSPDAETGGGSASLNVLPWQPLPPAQMSAVWCGTGFCRPLTARPRVAGGSWWKSRLTRNPFPS